MKVDELRKAVAQELGTTQKEATRILDGVFGVIEEAVVEGKKVPLGGIGKLGTTERAARKGRNPQSGEEIDIPAKTAPKMTFSANFKDVVNQ